MPEEYVVGDQHGYWNDGPTSKRAKFFGHLAKLGYATASQIKLLQASHESGRCATRQNFHLPGKQIIPHLVVFGCVICLRWLQPVIAHMRRLFQRRSKDIRWQFGQD